MRIHIIQIPPQAAEDILTRLKEDIKLTGTLFVHPIDIALHVPLRVTRTQNRHLSLQQLGQGLCPLVRRGRVAQTGVEQHEAVEIRVEGLEVLCLIHGVEVVDVRGDLHLAAETVFDDAAEGVGGRAFRQWELCVAVGHGFGADEDEVQQGAGEHVGELEPDVSG